MSTGLVGKPLERLEDARLLTGRGRYTDDAGSNAVQAAFVRSEHAHARIVDVDLAEARAVEGVLGAYTYQDLDGAFAAPFLVARPHDGIVAPRTPTALASGEVHYAGQPIAMIVARDRYVAEDAAAAVRIEYEVLPAVVGVDEALDAGSGTAHSDMTDNICAVISEEIGDVDAALAAADRVFEWRFELERAAGMPIEPRSVLADFDAGAGHLTVYDTTQLPLLVRTTLAGLFGLDLEDVEIVAGDLGGGFGPKLSPIYPEEALVPWASRRLGRPVKWTEDRREHFVGTNHLRTQVHRVQVGCTSEGRIVAYDDSFVHDSGAYCQYGVLAAQITAGHLTGPYAIENLRYELRAVYTNTVPTSPCRGAGIPYAAFAIERTLDRIAAELGIDRAEIRRRNFVQPDAFPHTVGVTYLHGGPVVYDSGNYPAGLELLLEELGYSSFPEERRKAAEQGRRIGLGLACYVEATGGGPFEGARVSVMPDGSVTVSTGAASSGQGHETAFAQIVADELSLPVERVSVRTGDSRRISYGMGTYASRVGVVVGNAVQQASQAVRRKASALAAGMFEASPEDIELSDGVVRLAGVPQAEMPLGQLAIASLYLPPAEGQAPGLSAEEYYAPAEMIFASGVHGAVVEIDPGTFDISIRRYVAVHDCGPMINPLIVKGQVVGGVAHGIGDSLYERIAYDEAGQLQNASFMDYLMPYATEIPAVEVHHTETPSPVNPLGLKGAGEAGAIPVAAVLASAIEDALGEPILAMPLSPLRLFELRSPA